MKRFPVATIALAAAIVLVYLHFSGGRLFIPQGELLSLSFYSSNPAANLVLHLFAHLGTRHLLGNLVPLVLFAAVLEYSAGVGAVLAVFFLSGVAASIGFSLLNPSIALAGASGGVAGLIGASALARPKLAVVLLLALPLLVQFVVFPAVDAGVSVQRTGLETQQANLSAQVTQLVLDNKSVEAAAANNSLRAVVEQRALIDSGVLREAGAVSDVAVHLFGALVGMAYLVLRRPDLVDAGSDEVFSLVGRVRRRLVKK